MASLADLRTFFAQPPPRQVTASVRTHLLSGARRWQWVMMAATVACAIGFLIFFPWRLADTLQVDFDGQSGYGEVRQSVFVKIAVGKHIFMRRKRLFSTSVVYIDHLGTSQVAYCLTTRQHKPGERVAIEFSRSYPQIARTTNGFFVSGGYWAGLWAMLFPLLVVFGAWNYHRWRWQRNRLLVHGVLTEGVVEQLWTDGSPDKNNGWVAFRFDVDGHRIQVTETTNGVGLQRARQTARNNGHLTVLYTRSAPRDCLVLEFIST